MELINWPWLEDLLVRACDAEIRAFGAAHPEARFFAFALEFDGLTGTLHLSYGTRESVENAFAALPHPDPEEMPCYRAVELRPENWTYRCRPVLDPTGSWDAAEQVLEKFRTNVSGDRQPAILADLDPDADEKAAEIVEFYWLRFEFLAECVVRRLLEKDPFNSLNRETEFLAYACNEHEYLEELEDRLQKLYPRYRRATAEWVAHPRFGLPSFQGCRGEGCREPRGSRDLQRCTCCHRWYCEACRPSHGHPELARRMSFFID